MNKDKLDLTTKALLAAFRQNDTPTDAEWDALGQAVKSHKNSTECFIRGVDAMLSPQPLKLIPGDG